MTQTSRPDLLIIDTETSGTSVSRGHEAIQVAGIRLDGDTLVEKASFVSWVRPQRPETANPYAMAVSGATLARLATAPRVSEVVAQLRVALGLVNSSAKGLNSTDQSQGRTSSREQTESQGQTLGGGQAESHGLTHSREAAGFQVQAAGEDQSQYSAPNRAANGGLGNNHQRPDVRLGLEAQLRHGELLGHETRAVSDIDRGLRGEALLVFDPRPPLVVAHSLPFDRAFWDDMFRRGGVAEGFPLGSTGMCSLRWLRSVRPRTGLSPTRWDARTGARKTSDKLADWAEAVGLSQPSTHDALEDVRLLAEVLRRIRARLPYEVWL